MVKKTLSPKEKADIIGIMKKRFEMYKKRHESIMWSEVERRLLADETKLWSLNEMERTGGEPDVIVYDKKPGEYLIFDCSQESPKGRRSLCYDREALDSRKELKPKDSAWDMAVSMGIEMLDEEQYRLLQELGEFDLKTSSWIKTPKNIRKLGGAIFCDRRYSHVFTYHNGAESYYAARGFRGLIKI